MSKNELQYYELTLNNGKTSITIGDRVIPIIGVFTDKDETEMREVLTGKLIEEKLDKKPTGKLAYLSKLPVDRKRTKTLEDLLFSLSIPEKEEFKRQMDGFEKDVLDRFNLNHEARGIGDIMYRRLAINSGQFNPGENKA